METGAQIGERLTALKAASGYSWDRIARMVYDHLGEYAPTAETIRAWGRGEVKSGRIDPVVVTALADVLGCSVADISTAAAATMGRLNSLLKRVDIDLSDTHGARETGPLSSGSDGIGWLRGMGLMDYPEDVTLAPVISRSLREELAVACR